MTNYVAAQLSSRKIVRLQVAIVYLLFSFVYLQISLQQSCAAAPNIVFILADDQGWNGTSVQMDPNVPGSKSDFYQTPRLEQLAASGMRFSDAYSSTPVCSPTRAAIQTGKSPAQLQMISLPDARPGSSRWLTGYTGLPMTPPLSEPLNPNSITVAHAVKQANPNYSTAIFGKWHLNSNPAAIPTNMGYDIGNAFNHMLPSSQDPKDVFDLANTANSYMQDRVAENQPFFLTVSHTAVHLPNEARQEIRDKYAASPPGTVHSDPVYAAMTEDLDTSVGMILDKIDELGIADNTYVIYASDNGPLLSQSSGSPLRRGKGGISEGGIRVPFMISGPGIEANSVSRVPVSTTDLFTTIAAMAGNTGPVAAEVEGGNLLPVLENGGVLPAGVDHVARNFTPGGELYWHWPVNQAWTTGRRSPESVIRDGDFKLIVRWGESGGADKYFLHNLSSDISESVNLASSMPQKVAELKAKLDNYLADVDAPMAFDVEQDVIMDWDAAQSGVDPNGWRSAIDLNYKARETWGLGGGSERPALHAAHSFQPGLPSQAFGFDGNDVMRRLFFQVGDDGPLKVTVNNPGPPDWDRSATIEMWVRSDSLSQGGILMESGDGTAGISVTLGDADGDGLKNDMRFRVLGLVGADTGTGVLQGFSATAKIDEFANPTRDFVHLVAVFNDDPDHRYQEIYVNGALAARVDATLGPDGSPQWDGYDMAGLGNIGGNGLGGNGGTGDLPFSGGFHGEFAKVRYYNYAVSSGDVRTNYNGVLAPASYGVVGVTGNAATPTVRPTDVSIGMHEEAYLTVVQERQDILDNPLMVDAIVNSSGTISSEEQATPGQLPAGLEFNSYLLQFDPLGTVGGDAVGSITFEGEILGILFDRSSLSSTDAILGSIGDYGDAADRGFDLGAEGEIGVFGGGHQLVFNLSILGSDMLQFRVLTSAFNQADFNGDGHVDDLDLAIWQNGFGRNAAGDADRDGDTDGRDFLIWQRLSQSALLSSQSTAVPEPTTCLLVWVAGVICCGLARRLRCR